MIFDKAENVCQQKLTLIALDWQPTTLACEVSTDNQF